MIPTKTVVLAALLVAGSLSSAQTPRVFSMDEAATTAVAAKPGNVVGSYVVEGRHHTKYVFEITSPEGTWKVKVDAATGKVMRSCLVDGVGANGCRYTHRAHRNGTQLGRNSKVSFVSPDELEP